VWLWSLIYWKQYKFKFNILLNKKFKNWFHFFTCISPDYLMVSSKNFEKIAILKKWQLVFFWCVKTYFGEIPLKWCSIRHEIFYFHQYCPSNSNFWSFQHACNSVLSRVTPFLVRFVTDFGEGPVETIQSGFNLQYILT